VYVLNTTKIDGKEYAMVDIKPGTMRPLDEWGIPDHFYGGRVQYIGRTNSDILCLVNAEDNISKVIDLAVEKLDNLPNDILRKLCYAKKLNLDKHGKQINTTPKDKLLELLEPWRKK
jgi:hypothetical protein